MSKKGKKKLKLEQQDVLYKIDNSLDKKYLELREEILYMQADVDRIVKKEKKKAIKKMKKGNTFYEYDGEEVRRKVIKKMEGNNFFERIEEALRGLRPIVVLLAELVKALIVSILNLDYVKYRVSPNTLRNMQTVYSLANTVVGK